MSEYEKFEEMLSDFKDEKFDNLLNTKQTFFDITRYPHYENVVSNILEFLFDSKEEHEFGNLWIKSLLDAYSQKSNEILDFYDYETDEVLREYSKGNNKRIDLLICCSNLIVVIENKIYADVNNPFTKYEESAKAYAKEKGIDNPSYVFILLSLNKQKEKWNRFMNITYDELFSSLEKNLKLGIGNVKWTIFSNEFVQNIRNMKGYLNMKLDEKWINFVNKNKSEIKKLSEQVNQDAKDRLNIVKRIDEFVDEKYKPKGVYNGSLYVSQYTDTPLKDVTACIETYLMKNAFSTKKNERYDTLYISLWTRNNQNYKGLDNLLKALKCKNPYEVITEGKYAWGRHFILDEIDITKEFSIEDIANKINNYSKILKNIKDY